MENQKRKNSPRAPSLPLDDAIARATKVYTEEGRHDTPVEVVMKHIGYSAKSGAANRAIASLRYWGLVDRTSDSKLEITKAFETYQFAPDEAQKQAQLVAFLRKPAIIAELLDKYKERLPSDATIKYDLIQKGFFPDAADDCLQVFKRSLNYAKFYEYAAEKQASEERESRGAEDENDLEQDERQSPGIQNIQTPNLAVSNAPPPEQIKAAEATGLAPTAMADIDRIPVRLSGNRRAYIEVPIPFYKADVDRLKAQIELLLTDDE